MFSPRNARKGMDRPAYVLRFRVEESLTCVDIKNRSTKRSSETQEGPGWQRWALQGECAVPKSPNQEGHEKSEVHRTIEEGGGREGRVEGRGLWRRCPCRHGRVRAALPAFWSSGLGVRGEGKE